MEADDCRIARGNLVLVGMNPYEAPQTHAGNAPDMPGKPCDFCGSTNTGHELLPSRRINVLWFLFFGWLYFLITLAFSKEGTLCRDCGETSHHRKAGARVAMVVLGFIVLSLVAILVRAGSHLDAP